MTVSPSLSLLKKEDINLSRFLDFRQFKLTYEYEEDAFRYVKEELYSAIHKHENFPATYGAANTVKIEEVGEASKAALDAVFGNSDIHGLRESSCDRDRAIDAAKLIIKEEAQAAAMHIRTIQALLIAIENESR